MADFRFTPSPANRASAGRLTSLLSETNGAVGSLRNRLSSIEALILDGFGDKQRRAAQRAALEAELRRTAPIRPGGAL